MRHSLLLGVILIGTLLIVGGSWVTRTGAQSATPPASGGTTKVETLTVVERNDHTTDVDLGSSGPSVRDLRVWGPNPLYDATNTSDTGATTQGSCVALNPSFACVLTETILFADGSTLEFQGVEQGGTAPSTRTIIGGSGAYLGATGVASVVPTDDSALWTRSIEIVRP